MCLRGVHKYLLHRRQLILLIMQELFIYLWGNLKGYTSLYARLFIIADGLRDFWDLLTTNQLICAK